MRDDLLQMRVYAFLDLENPAVMWAVMRGRLVSVDTIPEWGKAGFLSFMSAGLLDRDQESRIETECIIENVRKADFPHLTSRLRGMFFFAERLQAQSCIGDRTWPEYFTQENLVEFDLEMEGSHTIVDADWISHRRMVNLSQWQNYWRGQEFNKKPIWEVIASGTALVRDKALRMKCRQKLERIFPDAHIAILMAQIGGDVESSGGLITPFLHEADGEYGLIYMMNSGDFNLDDVIEKVVVHPEAKRLHDMTVGKTTWPTPDFLPLSKAIDLIDRQTFLTLTGL